MEKVWTSKSYSHIDGSFLALNDTKELFNAIGELISFLTLHRFVYRSIDQ